MKTADVIWQAKQKCPDLISEGLDSYPLMGSERKPGFFYETDDCN